MCLYKKILYIVQAGKAGVTNADCNEPKTFLIFRCKRSEYNILP